MHIAKVLQKWTNLFQLFISLSKSLQTSTFCHLISMDHKESVSFLISSLGVNKLFYMSGNSYPIAKTSCKPTQQLHMILLRNWIMIKGKINQGNIFYFPIFLSQKPRSFHKMQ